MPDGGSFVGQIFAKFVRPKDRLSHSQWADLYRRLSVKGSSEPGQWRTSRVPFIREIMDCLSIDNPVREVVFMKSTQTAGSEVGLNWVGYVMDYAPGPMLAVLPTVEVGERWSKQRLGSMIAESARLSRLIAPSKSRDGGNTILIKEFKGGGILIIGGANSAASLSSMPIKFLLLDEVDRFPFEVESEGDPIDLAERRTTTFPGRKIFKVSSPTVESTSRILKDWKRSDQRHYHVPCPDCGHMQRLVWDNLFWPADEPQKAAYRCAECASLIEHDKKTWMLEHGKWIATFPEREVAGFHINGLYTPVGLGDTWAQHAKKFLEVKNDPVQYKVFVNTVLGECYSDESERLDWEAIKARAEPYLLRVVPEGCLILTAGVDVQKNRIEIQIRGFGQGGQRWTIDWHYIAGDPTRAEVWEALDKYLDQPLLNQRGIAMRVAAVAVDSGFLAPEVYNYVRARRHRNIYAVKGGHAFSQNVLKRPSKQDFKRNGQLIKSGAEVYEVSVNALKQQLFARLASDASQPMQNRVEHFSDQLPEDYFMQITSEVFDPSKRRYVNLKDRRNEGLDTLVYAEAIAHHPVIRVGLMRDPDWARLRQVYEPDDLFSRSAEPAVANALSAPTVDAPVPATSAPRAQQWIQPRQDWLR